MSDEAEHVTGRILTAMRNEHRRDMRELAHQMIGLTTEMKGLREEMRDIKGRLEDVVRLQVTKGDLDVIHFELNRFAERLDARETEGRDPP
jgi:hypothetical protein